MLPRRRKPLEDTFVESSEARGDLDRETFLSLARNYLSLLKKGIIDARPKDKRGRALVEGYTRVVDALVAVLFQRALEENSGGSPDKVDVAIVGMGGYGRAELAPFSDVDILVLCRRKTALIKRVVSSFVQLMWDAGFELGHSVESLIESESTLARHMDTRTALFESRWICGSKSVAKEVEGQIRRLRRRDQDGFLRRKIQDAVARHEKYSNSYQLIEPNVKLSPGGLRDFQTLVWLGMVGDGQVGLAALRSKGLLLPGEVKVLQAAYDFLLRVRFELHLGTESKQDQLTVRMQKAITENLGYRAKGGHLGVELFMKDYYNHTRAICHITEDIIDELQYGKNLGILIGRKKVPTGKGKLTARIDRHRIKRDPLYVFVKQKESGLKLDRSLKRRLEAALHDELSGRICRNRMRRDFPSLLKSGQNLSLVLRSMHETGFLGAIIPEYNELTSLKRYDLYHHYTVDEHSFQVVHNLELLGRPVSKRVDPLRRLYSEIADKQILFMAALLHDIGKIEGRGHARKGALLAKKILGRMLLNQEVIETVSYLIRVHLLMSHFSQRRDPTDPGTIRSFCQSAKNRTILKHLCLLTHADLKATSPLVWTEWKQSLLWALYVQAYDFMARKEKKPDTIYKARKRALLRVFPVGPDRERALAHLDMLPGRYLLTMRARDVKNHMEIIEKAERQSAVVSARKGKSSTEITFCTMDKPYRLSQLCGVLTLNDCNILFAYAFTRSDGRVLDIFHVEDFGGTEPIDDDRIGNIEEHLKRAINGSLEMHSSLETHLRKWKRERETSIPVPVSVEFENDMSGDVTIIDIHAMDEPGLLFKITRALSDEGLTIHRARISTEANRAIDSFDVQDSKGRKITDAAALRRIRKRLEDALS